MILCMESAQRLMLNFNHCRRSKYCCLSYQYWLLNRGWQSCLDQMCAWCWACTRARWYMLSCTWPSGWGRSVWSRSSWCPTCRKPRGSPGRWIGSPASSSDGWRKQPFPCSPTNSHLSSKGIYAQRMMVKPWCKFLSSSSLPGETRTWCSRSRFAKGLIWGPEPSGPWCKRTSYWQTQSARSEPWPPCSERHIWTTPITQQSSLVSALLLSTHPQYPALWVVSHTVLAFPVRLQNTSTCKVVHTLVKKYFNTCLEQRGHEHREHLILASTNSLWQPRQTALDSWRGPQIMGSSLRINVPAGMSTLATRCRPSWSLRSIWRENVILIVEKYVILKDPVVSYPVG